MDIDGASLFRFQGASGFVHFSSLTWHLHKTRAQVGSCLSQVRRSHSDCQMPLTLRGYRHGGLPYVHINLYKEA